jgi:hypothetical protein
MNRKPRPLALSRKTLRSLTESDLASANGAMPPRPGDPVSDDIRGICVELTKHQIDTVC